jgi:hypothetical protein
MTCRRSLSGTLRAGIGTIDPHPGFLFDEGETAIPLKLLSSQTFQTGALNLVYAPRRIRPHGPHTTQRRTCRTTPDCAATVDDGERVDLIS